MQNLSSLLLAALQLCSCTWKGESTTIDEHAEHPSPPQGPLSLWFWEAECWVSFFAFLEAILGKFPIQKGKKKSISDLNNFNQIEQVK